ncbi:type II secretion system F family protein [Planctomicrobium sp. SH668]|uniref:type II secretion system F family protein n=1 Tax=Planctomicrobium sp. SH668 TaxID=3448126 RepID=UPI003F5B25B6
MGMTSDNLLMIAALVATGLAWGTIAWITIRIFTPDRSSRAGLEGLEVKRRDSLKKASSVYRNCGNTIRDFMPFTRVTSPERNEAISTEISLTLPEEPWTPSEYFAAQIAIALVTTLVLFMLLSIFLPVIISFVISSVFGLLAYVVTILSLSSSVSHYRKQFQYRLPFAIDLLTLNMEAGAELTDSMKVVANENKKHPIGYEFGRVNQQANLGLRPEEALETMVNRVKSEDAKELVFAIIKGREHGTSIVNTLRIQSEQIHLRKSQLAERLAKEAEIKMTGPNMCIMLACVIAIMGPILLPILYGTGIGF